ETTQTVPSPNVTEIDKNAYVEDTFDPFSVTGLTLSGNIYREWSVTTASWTQSYSVLVSNSGAASGQYYLHNTAVIYGEDTDDEYDRDDETVTITAYSSGGGSETAWAEGPELPGGVGWATYFFLDPTEESTTVRLIGGQNIVVGTVTAEWVPNGIGIGHYVHVTIRTAGGWVITETNVEISENLSDLGKAPGNYSLGEIFTTPVTVAGPYFKLFSKTNRVYIAAHAVVQK
ncbi:MAG: hypothetical protein JW701_05875, partial [Kosmotogaceae bacterium]|nr:hypothetical protein [Kosmotogaceae bacterium]